MTKPNLNNFYFWLGADGEMESFGTNRDGFERRISENAEQRRKWEGVDVVSD